MTGIKGMKWREKPDKVRQCYASLETSDFEKIEKMRKELNISRSYLINIAVRYYLEDHGL